MNEYNKKESQVLRTNKLVATSGEREGGRGKKRQRVKRLW